MNKQIKIILIILYFVFALWYFSFNKRTITVSPQIIEIGQVHDQPSISPLMEKIAKCESSLYQTAVNENKRADGTVWSRDWGKFQINDFYWGDLAEELELDYKYSEADNTKLAMIILQRQGLVAWSASKYCWNG